MNLGVGQPAIPPEDEFFVAMNCALKDAFASLQSELQNVIHDAFEQLRLTTPTLATSLRRLEHSSTPISDSEVEIVHSHLWKARCKQVALTSTAATGGVKKPYRFGLGASTIQKIAKYQKRSSAASLLLDDAISTQSNHNLTSLGLVSGTDSSVPDLNFVNNGSGSSDYVPGAMLSGVDTMIFDNEKRSLGMTVIDSGDGRKLSEHEGIGVKLDGMQGPYSCECHALKVFDEMSTSDGFCGSKVAALTSIRDKGGGIKTHRDCNVSLMSTEGCGSNCSGNILQSQGFSKSSLRAGGLFQAISFKKKCTLRGSRAFHKLENNLRAELNIRHVKGCYYVKVETSISVGDDEQRGKMIAAIMDRSEQDGLLPIQSSSSIETMGKVEEAWEVDIPYCSTQFVTNSEELTAEFENAEVLFTYQNIPAIKDSTTVPISSVMGCSSEGNGHFSTKTDEQGLNLCEKNATYLFDEVLQSNWLCNAGLKMAAYMGIRDKGGGLTTHFETFDATHVSIKASFQLPEKNMVTNHLYCKPSLVIKDLGSEVKMVHQIQGFIHHWGWCKQELGGNVISAMSLYVLKASDYLAGNKILILVVPTKTGSMHNDVLNMSCTRPPDDMVEQMNGYEVNPFDISLVGEKKLFGSLAATDSFDVLGGLKWFKEPDLPLLLLSTSRELENEDSPKKLKVVLKEGPKLAYETEVGYSDLRSPSHLLLWFIHLSGLRNYEKAKKSRPSDRQALAECPVIQSLHSQVFITTISSSLTFRTAFDGVSCDLIELYVMTYSAFNNYAGSLLHDDLFGIMMVGWTVIISLICNVGFTIWFFWKLEDMELGALIDATANLRIDDVANKLIAQICEPFGNMRLFWHVSVEGTALVLVSEDATSNQTSSRLSVQEQVLVKKIIKLQDKYGCLINHSRFHKTLKEAYVVLCNKAFCGNSNAELLAAGVCDNIFKKGGSGKLSKEAMPKACDHVNQVMCAISEFDTTVTQSAGLNDNNLCSSIENKLEKVRSLLDVMTKSKSRNAGNLVVKLLSLEARVIVDHGWELHFLDDTIGRIDNCKVYVRSNLDCSNGIGLPITCLQGATMLAMIPKAFASDQCYDSDDGYISEKILIITTENKLACKWLYELQKFEMVLLICWYDSFKITIYHENKISGELVGLGDEQSCHGYYIVARDDDMTIMEDNIADGNKEHVGACTEPSRKAGMDYLPFETSDSPTVPQFIYTFIGLCGYLWERIFKISAMVQLTFCIGAHDFGSKCET